MVWSRRLSVSMGQPEDFAKALSEALKDNTIQEQFRSILQPTIEDPNRDLNNQLDIWRKHFTDDLRKELDSLRKNIETKDRNIAELENEIEILKVDQDRLEQYSRRNSLRISGLPEQNDENVRQRIVDLCNKKVKVPIQTSDIDRINRVGKPGPPAVEKPGPAVVEKSNPPARPKLVRFATYGARASVIRAKAVLRPGGRHPDAPWALGMAAGLTGDSRASPGVSANDAAGESDGDAAGNDPDDDDETEDDIDYTKVYISEYLTRNRQYLF